MLLGANLGKEIVGLQMVLLCPYYLLEVMHGRLCIPDLPIQLSSVEPQVHEIIGQLQSSISILYGLFHIPQVFLTDRGEQVHCPFKPRLFGYDLFEDLQSFLVVMLPQVHQCAVVVIIQVLRLRLLSFRKTL